MLGGLFVKAIGDGLYKVSDGMFGNRFPYVNLPALRELMEDFRVDHETALQKWAAIEPYRPSYADLKRQPKPTITLGDLEL